MFYDKKKLVIAIIMALALLLGVGVVAAKSIKGRSSNQSKTDQQKYKDLSTTTKDEGVTSADSTTKPAGSVTMDTSTLAFGKISDNNGKTTEEKFSNFIKGLIHYDIALAGEKKGVLDIKNSNASLLKFNSKVFKDAKYVPNLPNMTALAMYKDTVCRLDIKFGKDEAATVFMPVKCSKGDMEAVAKSITSQTPPTTSNTSNTSTTPTTGAGDAANSAPQNGDTTIGGKK